MEKEIFDKAKKVIVTVGMCFAILGLIFGVGKAVVSDIPTMITGEKDITLTTEEIEREYGVTISRPKTVTSRKVSFGESFASFIDNVMLAVISGTVLIMYPAYKKSE